MIQIIPNFHPVVVHFPIALTIVAFAATLASQLFKKRTFTNQLAIVSHYMLWLAAATALVAVAFGWLAYNSVNHDDAGHAAMNVHRIWALTTTAVLVLLALFDFKKHQSSTVMPIYLVCLLALASALVGGTAWLGGEVVYRHGIGVLALPQPEAEAAGHEHAAGAEDHDAMQMDMPEKSEPTAEPASTEAPAKQAEPAIHDAKDGHKHQHTHKANP
jgi:uncharacterized membrane protein